MKRFRIAQWREQFPEEILRDGFSMFKKGKAKDLAEELDHETGNLMVQLRVRGKRYFFTEYEISNRYQDAYSSEDIVEYISCSCGERQNGVCEHLAAGFYLIESELYLDRNDRVDEHRFGGSRERSDLSTHGKIKSITDSLETLIESESKKKLSEQGENRTDFGNYEIPPFFMPEKYLDSLAYDDDMLKKAQNIADNGGIQGADISYYYTGNVEGELQGEISAYVDDGQLSRARVAFGRSRIVSAFCMDWNCRFSVRLRSDNKQAVCVHTLALTLYLCESLKKNNTFGDSTNYLGIRLMNQVKGFKGAIGQSGEKGDGRNVILKPALHQDPSGRYTLSFKVGDDRLYKLKDLNEFFVQTKERGSIKLGTNKELVLSYDRFDPASRKWFDLLQRVYNEEKKRYDSQPKMGGRNRFYYSAPEFKLKNDINMYGYLFDLLYDQMGDEKLEFSSKYPGMPSKAQLVAAEGALRPKMELKRYMEDDIFMGVELTGTIPMMIEGVATLYYIEGDRLCRVPARETRQMEMLITGSRNGRISVKIGRAMLPDFYDKVLPYLRQIADIAEPDYAYIEGFVPPAPEYSFFLDYLEDSILCRATVTYEDHIHDLFDSVTGKTIESYRNKADEINTANALSELIPEYDPELNILFTVPDSETVYDFVSDKINILMDMGEVYMTERFKRLGYRKSIHFNMGVSVEGDLLSLDVLSDELEPEELMEVIKQYRQKKRYVRLKSGDFIKLQDNESIERLSEMLELLKVPLKQFVKGKMHIPMYRALYLDKMMEKNQDIYARRDSTFKHLIKEFKTVDDADYEVPEEIRARLRSYQTAGYRWLRLLKEYGFGGILADEMGLGKTLQVIAYLTAIKDKNKTSLVVCPASLVYNWYEEVNRFSPKLKALMVIGTKKERSSLIKQWKKYDLLITSYDLLKRDIDEYEGIAFDSEVADEAQYIKNQQTAAAKSVKAVSAVSRFALTGTPIENSLSDLWSIFDFLMPGFLYDYNEFKSLFEQDIVKSGDQEKSGRLSKMVTPFILRRKKADVLKDLPEKLEEVRYARIEDKQRELYDAHVARISKTIRNQSREDFSKGRIELLAELTKIRQVCCDPSLLYEDFKGSSAKRESCLELIDSIVDGGHKALIFTAFTSMIALLEEDLRKKGIRFYTITGATPKKSRLEMVNCFNSDDTPIFLISLKAGGTGLNLTGADIVIHYDPWWNEAAQNQATDRAHRIGQKKVVTVYKLIAKNTIEEKILKMQEAKSSLADNILNSEGISSGRLTREELLEILE